MVASQVCTMTDGILLSQFIGPNAIAAVNLYTPIDELAYSVAMILTLGSSVLAAKAIGNQCVPDACRHFSLSLYAILLVVGGVLSTTGWYYREELMSQLCDDPALIPHFAAYYQVMVQALILSGISVLLRLFVSIEGRPGLVAVATCVTCLANAGLDLLFIQGLEMGAAGSAWATLGSQLLGVVILLCHVCSQRSLFRLLLPSRAMLASLRPALRHGLSLSAPQIAFTLSVLAMNEVVLRQLGANGAYIWAIGLQIILFVSLVADGVSEVLESAGSLVQGEGDSTGFRMLVHTALRFTAIATTILMLIVEIRPQWMAILFGADSEALIEECVLPLRILSLILLPQAIYNVLATVYTLSGRLMMGALLPLLLSLSMLTGMLAFSAIDAQLLWWGLPSMVLVAVVLLVITAAVIRHKTPWIEPATLLSTLPDDISINRSVPYDAPAAHQTLTDVRTFLKMCEADDRTQYRVALCCEELFQHLLESNNKRGTKDYFDLRVVEQETDILVVIKDAGQPFNPTRTFKKLTADDLKADDFHDDLTLSLQLINNLCNDITYHYRNGLNQTILRFPK